MTFFYDLNKKLANINDKPTPKQLNEGKAAVDESIIGSIGQSLGKGIKKAGKALVGPSDQELAADLQDRMYPTLKKAGKAAMEPPAKPLPMAKPRTPIAKEEYGPLEEKGGAPMTPKQKKFAKLAPPKDKITFADKIAGAKKEVDEMLGDVAAEAMRGALKGGQKKLDKNHNGKLDAQDFAMLRKGGKQETDEGAGAKKVTVAGLKNWIKTAKEQGYSVEGPSEFGLYQAYSKTGAHRGTFSPEDQPGPGSLRGTSKPGMRANTGTLFVRQVADEGWDDMIKDVDRRRSQMKKGEKVAGHKGEIEKTEKGIKHTRRYDDKTGETDVGDDDTPKGEKRRGRPKGTGKAMGAKGPSGKSKLMTKEAEQDSAELKRAMAMLKKAGYKVSKEEQELDETEMGFAKVEKAVAKNPKVKNPAAVAAAIGREKYGQKEMTRRSVAGRKNEAEELDEKAVSQQQQKFMGMVHAMQKGEKVKGASPELKKVARTMKPKDAEDFAKTKHKGLPKKKTEEVEETATDAPKAGKGGMQFGKGIYDSMNRELEQMIAESMNISMNMSNNPDGGPSKSLTVTATDEDALYLGKLLKMAGVGGGEAGGCGCGQTPCACNSAEQVDENQPDWPTETETSDNALQYAGGLNKPKTTVAGDGQTTVPVTAVQVREGEEEEELDEQEQVMAPESKEEELDEELQRIREMAGIKEAAKPDYIDLDKDGNKKESMKKAADDAEKDKKVEESILNLTNLWKAYKG